MEKRSFFTAKNVATLGILLALVIVLQAFGGTITIGAISLNFTLIPIVLGAIVLGPIAGAFLGLACGIVVLIQVIIAPVGSGFYYIIWQNDPFVTVITCLLKTTVAGLVAGFLFDLLVKKNRYVAVFLASGIVPILNTGIFILCCLMMSDSIAMTRDFMINEWGKAEFLGMNPFIFTVVVLVSINFFAEFAVNLLVAPGIHTVYKVVENRFKR